MAYKDTQKYSKCTKNTKSNNTDSICYYIVSFLCLFRDFAYVARDRMTRKHMCHVFRCDTPARQIANTLRDICKKIMMERAQQSLATPSSSAEPQVATKVHRPTNLPDLQKAGETNGQKLTFQNFYKSKRFACDIIIELCCKYEYIIILCIKYYNK